METKHLLLLHQPTHNPFLSPGCLLYHAGDLRAPGMGERARAAGGHTIVGVLCAQDSVSCGDIWA